MDVTALGEMLIDFTPAGTGPMGNPCFEMNPGGGPANCLAAVAALGGKAGFIGKLGRDNFGKFLVQKLQGANIDDGGAVFSDEVHTTLAFVHLDPSGERSFSFLRKPGADIMLEKEEIPVGLIDAAKIFHFSSLSLTDEPVRSATFYAVQKAKELGKIISYDPNYRKLLWQSEADAVHWMKQGLEPADIVKMSEEEMSLLTGVPEDAVEEGAKIIFKMGKKAVFITLGKNGVYYLDEKESGFVPGFSVQAVDTTGCGDAFTGAMLYLFCNKPEWDLKTKARFACAAGALCATKKGGFPAMPSYEETAKLAGK